MQFFKRLVSQVLILQLFMSCTSNNGSIHSGVKNSPVLPGNTIEINGLISQAFKSISNILISEAMAASGTITLYDLTNPETPVEIYSQEITGSSYYSIKLNKAEVSSKILKASFISNEDMTKSRDILFEVKSSDVVVDGSMNEDLTLQALILEEQLQFELNQGEIQLAEIKERFRIIKDESTSEITDILGDKATVMKLSQNPETKKMFREIAVQYKRALKESDEAAQSELRQKLFDVGKSSGAMTSDSVISCNGSSGYFLFQDRTYNVFAVSDQAEIWNTFGKRLVFDKITSSNSASDIFLKLKNILKEVSDKYETRMSAVIYFEPADGIPSPIQSCKISIQESYNSIWKAPEEFPYKVDLTLFKKINYTDFETFDEVQSQIVETYFIAIKDLYTKLEETDLSSDQRNMILWKEIQLSNEEVTKTVEEIYAYFIKSKYPEMNDAFNTTFFDIIFYNQIDSVDQGQNLMAEALENSIENLKYNLRQSGLEEGVQADILQEKAQIAKKTYEVRMKILEWNYSNFRF